MRLSSASAAAALAFATTTVYAASKQDDPRPCTVKSSSTGSFFDLSPITIEKPSGKKAKDKVESWHAGGYDYSANFTLNFCAPVVEELKEVVGLHDDLVEKVAAYYEEGDYVYSIGAANDIPVLRGRKLVLNYTGGSPCEKEDIADKRSIPLGGGHGTSSDHRTGSKKGKGKGKYGDDEDEDDEDEDDDERPHKGDRYERRKSTVISFLCDRDPLKAEASVAFVAASPDKCTYFFEVRSQAACGGSESKSSGLGPGGVFGIIVLIAVSVYLVGGCVYQRTVMHQRGWMQLPNYSFWSSIFGFLQDMFVIAFSSCARFLPSRRGYQRVSANGNARGRGSNAEDENRLIDQLDEEWDD
ncbi:MAG: Cation-independent mannose-6-phosphate receptor CI-MPR [Bogoriella megaspora]|nr:MAG: Cation-independent mannose-6-phosphate receptor CI-MPR [Bogoriella megaspora]